MTGALSTVDAAAWLEALDGSLPRHAALLRHLVAGARADPRIVQLSIGCSLPRGAGDDLSDLDCEMSLEPEAWPRGLELVERLVRSAGSVVDLLHHHWPGAGSGPSRRTAVQYADGVQLDLMVWPVSVWSGVRPPDVVVLHATREVYPFPWDPRRGAATAEQLREWAFLGAWSICDTDKYLRRSSPWEARQRLEQARDAVWRLLAIARSLPFAQHGITALLDAPRPDVPAELDATAAGLDLDELRAALVRVAALLEAAWPAAAVAVGAPTTPTPALVVYARGRASGPSEG